MPTVLDELPLDERITAALLEHDEPEGRLLAGVLAYERGDFDACHHHGVDLFALAGAYREGLDWSRDATPHLA